MLFRRSKPFSKKSLSIRALRRRLKLAKEEEARIEALVVETMTATTAEDHSADTEAVTGESQAHENASEDEDHVPEDEDSDDETSEDNYAEDENYNLEVDIEHAFIDDGFLDYVRKNHSSLPPTDDDDLGIGKDYTASTTVKRCARYLAYVLTSYPDMVPDRNLSYSTLFRDVIYHKEEKVHEFCKFMRTAHSYTPSTVCNIILDLMKGARWAHFYSAEGQSDERAFARFAAVISQRKKQWTRLLLQERAKGKRKNSFENLIKNGDIPADGLRGMQKTLAPLISSVMQKMKTIVDKKVEQNYYDIIISYSLIQYLFSRCA